MNLLCAHAREPLQELVNGNAVVQVLEKGNHRKACSRKAPCSPHFLGVPINRYALTPVHNSSLPAGAGRWKTPGTLPIHKLPAKSGLSSTYPPGLRLNDRSNNVWTRFVVLGFYRYLTNCLTVLSIPPPAHSG